MKENGCLSVCDFYLRWKKQSEVCLQIEVSVGVLVWSQEADDLPSKRFQVQSPMHHTHSLHTLGSSFGVLGLAAFLSPFLVVRM